jgi:hypothetical protein
MFVPMYILSARMARFLLYVLRARSADCVPLLTNAGNSMFEATHARAHAHVSRTIVWLGSKKMPSNLADVHACEPSGARFTNLSVALHVYTYVHAHDVCLHGKPQRTDAPSA